MSESFDLVAEQQRLKKACGEEATVEITGGNYPNVEFRARSAGVPYGIMCDRNSKNLRKALDACYEAMVRGPKTWPRN